MCPFGAIFDKCEVFDVLKDMRKGEKVIAMVAPAVLAQFGKPIEQVYGALKAAGFRCEIDTSAEKLGAKIRGGTMMKVPYMVIVGGKDEAAGVVSVRSRAEGDKGQMKLEELIAALNAEKEG